MLRAAQGERVPIVAVLALSLAAVTGRASAQAADPELPGLAARLAAMTAVTGYERQMVDSLVALVPGAVRDRAGNGVAELGSGDRRRLVACPISEPGYVVGGVRPDGWMTLRRAPGRGPPADGQLEGQRVTLFGRRGAVPGVIAVRSIHLTRGRPEPGEAPFTVDGAYLDIGAGSAPEVARAGVGVLSPLTLTKRPQRYGRDLLAAPAVARRTACASLVLAARRATAGRGVIPPGERVVVAFVVEQELGGRGIGTLANARGPFVETVMLDGAAGVPGAVTRAPDSLGGRWPGLGAVSRWSLGARYAGTPVETTALGGADTLRRALVAWIGGAR